MTTLGLDFNRKLVMQEINAQLKLVDLESGRGKHFPEQLSGYETTCGTMSSACA